MDACAKISVVIPLYNKEKEVTGTVDSVLSQVYPPFEVIVVNDGSTDGGADAVRNLNEPLVRVTDQPNGGVSAARNRGASEAAGDYVAFLDADDIWHPEYLKKINDLINAYPGCAAYSTGFNIVDNGKPHPADNPEAEGIIEDYFRTAMTSYVMIPSTTVVRKDVFAKTGGFPVGMKLAEDQYFLIKVASAGRVCFSPDRLADYNRSASNRSVSIYRPEKTDYSFEDLYVPSEGNSLRNEYIARCAISKAILLSAKGDTAFGRRTERVFGYTKLYRRGLLKLKILNRLPESWRGPALAFYEKMAWRIAKKGF